jgi:DNA polymerase III subunit gamma/tau
MSYQVIARKYRPQTFDEVVGQGLVGETLKNAISANRVAHSYIFSGARGVGKTSMARLLARCVNCIHGPTVKPCGQCPSCVEIAAGQCVDVLEIDAASNRGIDEIRGLRENVRYLPSRDRNKIFIIDEVHMLTTEAFNALLKTLEEPPERSLFILATTEAHKLPSTIQSRCQHFVFRLLDYSEILARLKEICSREKVDAPEGALSAIAQAADGSLRDALSLLDEVIAACGNRLDEAKTRQLIGVVSMEHLNGTLEAVHAGDARGVLERIGQLCAEGSDLSAFCGELTRTIRNLMIARSCGAQSPLLQVSDQDRTTIEKLAALYSEEDLSRFFQIMLRAQNEMRYSLQPRFHLELALMKLVHAGKLLPIEKLLSGGENTAAPVARSEVGAARRAAPPATRAQPAAPSANPARPSPIQAAPPSKQPTDVVQRAIAPSGQSAEATSAEEPAPDSAVEDERLAAIKATLFEQSKFLGSCLNPLAGWRFEGGQVQFFFSKQGSWAADLLRSREHQEKLQAACEKVLGQSVKIYVTLSPESGKETRAPLSSRQRAERDPVVETFRKRFDCVWVNVQDVSRGNRQ